jgi:uncharacterized glyoxalase superfamily protein PhnB
MNPSDVTTRTVIWPTLLYSDAPGAIRFLVEAFGFEERAVHPGEGEGVIAHAELRWPGGGGVMLGTHDPVNKADRHPPGTGSVYIVTDDIDARFERAVAAGARVLREPRDEDYGGRDFMVQDPEGVIWSFGTYAPE